MKSIARTCLALFVMASAIIACGQPSSVTTSPTAPPIAPTSAATSAAKADSTAEPTSSSARVYKFGLTPWQKGQTEDDIRALYKPMLDWLGRQIDAQFVIVGAKDYKQASELLANGTVQFASISPAPFVVAQKQTPGIKMLVTEMSWNIDKTKKSDSYTGYILTLKSRDDIKTVQDLKNKNFGFVSEESTSGFIIPNALLKDQGIDYQSFFAKPFFLGSHPRVTDALVAGSIDAGATWDFNWSQSIEKHGDVFKVVLTSPPIPNLGIAVHPSVPAEIQEQVRSALLKIDAKLLEGLPAAGYVIKPDSFYDFVRQLEASK